MSANISWKILFIAFSVFLHNILFAQDITELVEHRYVDNDGVSIHYAVTGNGPLIVMVHGFPDYWYTWRHQMEALKENYTVVALDTRGYNLSDQPAGVDNYTLEILVEDLSLIHI